MATNKPKAALRGAGIQGRDVRRLRARERLTRGAFVERYGSIPGPSRAGSRNASTWTARRESFSWSSRMNRRQWCDRCARQERPRGDLVCLRAPDLLSPSPGKGRCLASTSSAPPARARPRSALPSPNGRPARMSMRTRCSGCRPIRHSSNSGRARRGRRFWCRRCRRTADGSSRAPRREGGSGRTVGRPDRVPHARPVDTYGAIAEPRDRALRRAHRRNGRHGRRQRGLPQVDRGL
jgi:hypothetical protein